MLRPHTPGLWNIGPRLTAGGRVAFRPAIAFICPVSPIHGIGARATFQRVILTLAK